MPGSLVRDALAANLATGATLNAAGSTNGTAVEISKPDKVRVFLVTGTVTGTTPTIDVTIQGADDSGFTTNVVNISRFATTSGTGAAQSNITRVLPCTLNKRYVRAVVLLGGTSPVYTGTTITVREDHDRENQVTDTA